MKIVLIGANGQLGTDISKYFKEKGLEVFDLKHGDIEVCDFDASSKIISGINPDLVINTSAFHQVDVCEDEVLPAFKVNVLGVKNLAEICRETDSILMHFSTDYVFKGDKKTPYIESDCPDPINIYGISKLAGENAIRYLLNKYYIVRLSGLYGSAGSSGKGGNFIELMLRLAKEKKSIKVVNDQTLTPTSTAEVARKLYELIQADDHGIFHMTNSGGCSWYEFAVEIFRLAGLSPDLTPVPSQEFGAKAKRPEFSVLDNHNLRKAGISDLKHWKEALKEYMGL